jgi:hypothetical protein
MTATHKITYTINRGTGIPNSSKQSSVTNDGDFRIPIDIPVGANFEVTIAFALANLKSIVVLVDDDVTLKTNSSGAPDDTFDLKNDEPLIWNTKSKCLNPFTEPVTKFYFTNATADPVPVEIIWLADVTP